LLLKYFFFFSKSNLLLIFFLTAMHTCRSGTDASNSGLIGRIATSIVGTIGVTGRFKTSTRRSGHGKSFGGLACWVWVVPWVLLVLVGLEGVKGVPIPDGDCGDFGYRTCAIKQAVDAYITSGDTGSYGPIEDWDTSLVTDMSRLFQNKIFFNANISAWQVGKVTNMESST
jgi:hypothetical protein